MSKPWVCRLGWHRWKPAWNEAGQKYRHCDKCGADDDTASGIRAIPPVPRD
jgi:hypothetical protein